MERGKQVIGHRGMIRLERMFWQGGGCEKGDKITQPTLRVFAIQYSFQNVVWFSCDEVQRIKLSRHYD